MSDAFARIPYVRRCLLRRVDRRIEAVLCNLSVLGVYLTFLRPLPEAIPAAGEESGITFLLPDDPTPVEAEADVTWQNLEEPQDVDGLPVGCGLRFTALNPDDHQRIEELVRDYRHSARPRAAAPPPHSGLIRIPYVQPCLLVGGDAAWEGVLCNLSLLGVSVAVDPIPPRGESLHLFFKAPGAERPSTPPVRWCGRTRRSRGWPRRSLQAAGSASARSVRRSASASSSSSSTTSPCLERRCSAAHHTTRTAIRDGSRRAAASQGAGGGLRS
jgi:hypothetical protein